MSFIPIPLYLVFVLLIIVLVTTSLGALTGFSGSVFIVPIFSLVLLNYDIPFITIVGCSASGCFFNGLLSTILNIRKREIDWLLALIFEAPTMGGVFLGAYLTTRLNNQVITTFFAGFVVVLAIILLLKNRDSDEFPKINRKKRKEIAKIESSPKTLDEENREEADNNKNIKTQRKRDIFLNKLIKFGPQWKVERESYSYTINIFMLIGSALLIGTLAGMVGCGGGWVKAPVLISGFGVPSLIAISTSMLMTTITLLISGTMHIILGHFALWLWIIIAVGSIFGSLIGTYLKKRFNSQILQIIMTLTLIAIAIMLLIETWIG